MENYSKEVKDIADFTDLATDIYNGINLINNRKSIPMYIYNQLGYVEINESFVKNEKDIIKYVNDNFISKMKKGDRIGIIFLNTVSFLSNDKIQNIIKDNKEYERTPFIFLTFSALKNSLLYSFKDKYKIDSITQAGDWTLFVFKKIEN